MTIQAFRDHEIALVNPPICEIGSELCDGCHKEIMDDAGYRFRGGFYCLDCITPVVRCDRCGFVRCTCEEDE